MVCPDRFELYIIMRTATCSYGIYILPFSKPENQNCKIMQGMHNSNTVTSSFLSMKDKSSFTRYTTTHSVLMCTWNYRALHTSSILCLSHNAATVTNLLLNTYNLSKNLYQIPISTSSRLAFNTSILILAIELCISHFNSFSITIKFSDQLLQILVAPLYGLTYK